ncbi:hypothetical protein [uncultured Tateyamaria sp.]|uniref:hypothetical protein n=1 Tax=Tateyamaria sp. 1078 TaxID=3417464 RepID=UPI002626567B|nr:hypothetical protein [uncultured Tateyamaria sp.]
MRRTATITLHWLSLMALVLLVAGGPVPVLAWAFGLTGLGLCAIAAARGLKNGPGPKLTGALRVAHPWLSRAMYAALAATAAATLWHVAVGPVAGLQRLHFYLMSAASLHAIFHLWRHTALGDGALRRITPTSMHGVL